MSPHDNIQLLLAEIIGWAIAHGHLNLPEQEPKDVWVDYAGKNLIDCVKKLVTLPSYRGVVRGMD